jgi:hypothetical protein
MVMKQYMKSSCATTAEVTSICQNAQRESIGPAAAGQALVLTVKVDHNKIETCLLQYGDGTPLRNRL